jgi:hypothetical protein
MPKKTYSNRERTKWPGMSAILSVLNAIERMQEKTYKTVKEENKKCRECAQGGKRRRKSARVCE